MTDNSKDTSLLYYIINYGRKKFYGTGHRREKTAKKLKKFTLLEMFCCSNWAFSVDTKFEVNINLQHQFHLEVSVNLKLYGLRECHA